MVVSVFLEHMYHLCLRVRDFLTVCGMPQANDFEVAVLSGLWTARMSLFLLFSHPVDRLFEQRSRCRLAVVLGRGLGKVVRCYRRRGGSSRLRPSIVRRGRLYPAHWYDSQQLVS